MAGLDLKSADMSGIYSAMSNGFVGSLKSLISGIPTWLIIFFIGLVVFMGIVSFLKELKVI